MLVEYLAPEGFVTSTAITGPDGLEQLAGSQVDLVILDVMLPQLSGFEVLRRIRAISRVPVIMLTARGEEVDRVVGLELGADDYLAKPFSPRELVARIRAVMRRVPAEAADDNALIVWGPLRLDLRAHRAHAAAAAPATYIHFRWAMAHSLAADYQPAKPVTSSLLPRIPKCVQGL